MFKKLDRYIIKQLLATFFLAIAMIILIVIIFDLSEKMGDFIEKKAPMKAIIFDYYVNFIPYFVNLFGHLFFFIAVIFLSSRLASRSETVAVLSSGISFNRLLQPFIISAIFIALVNIYLTNLLIPQVNKTRIDFEQKYYRNQYKNNLFNIHLQLNDNTQVYVQSFDNSQSTGYNFSEEFFSNGQMTRKITADNIVFDSTTRQWNLNNYTIRDINELTEHLEGGTNRQLDLKLAPKDFNINTARVETMTFRQLNKFIAQEQMRGSNNVNDYLIEKYSRLINPLAYIILTLIGVSLSSRKTRGGTGLNLAIGITLAFSFIMMMKVCSLFSSKGNLPPFVSVCIPIVIYAVIGLL